MLASVDLLPIAITSTIEPPVVDSIFKGNAGLAVPIPTRWLASILKASTLAVLNAILLLLLS